MSRPWLALYERLPWARRDAARPALPPALIQRLLPPEMILEVFALLPPASLGAAACVCTDWRELAGEPALWRAALSAALGSQSAADAAAAKAGVPLTTRPTASTPSSSPLTWRSCFWRRRRCARMGCTSRATPIYGSASLSGASPATRATWPPTFGTCAFCRRGWKEKGGQEDGGPVLVSNVSRPPAKAARALALGPHHPHPTAAHPPPNTADRVLEGRWRLGRRSVVRTALRHDNTAVTEVRSRLRLRGTTPGAWNRLTCWN